MKDKVKNLVNSQKFEALITLAILINCILIGVETYFTNLLIHSIQNIILLIFAFEILFRFIARKNTKSYFQDRWNLFDIVIVASSLIPESLFSNSSIISIIRILRLFRILRLLKTHQEIKLIVSVLVKSVRSLFYNTLFFLIFFYLFSIIGVSLFKIPQFDTSLKVSNKIHEYKKIAPNNPINSPDPYGSLADASFTLFRITTGEDWTDIYYNLVIASRMDIIVSPEVIVTLYHVLWVILSSFLLLNLVVGSILNNYQVVMNEAREKFAQNQKDKN